MAPCHIPNIVLLVVNRKYELMLTTLDWADGVGFVGEKLARTFGLSASWRVIVDASSMRDRVWPKGWRDHRWPVSHDV